MIHVWGTQHEILQDKVLLGVLHLSQSLDLDQDVLVPFLYATVLASKNMMLAVLRSAKVALAEHGEVVADYDDLGFKVRIDLDPWEAQDLIVGCALKSVRALGFDLQQRPTRNGRVTRTAFERFVRHAPHLMMLAMSLREGYITSRREPPPSMFSGSTSTRTLLEVGAWCSSRPQEYDALIRALTTGVTLRRSWKDETP